MLPLRARRAVEPVNIESRYARERPGPARGPKPTRGVLTLAQPTGAWWLNDCGAVDLIVAWPFSTMSGLRALEDGFDQVASFFDLEGRWPVFDACFCDNDCHLVAVDPENADLLFALVVSLLDVKVNGLG